jgi:hypothetical protein
MSISAHALEDEMRELEGTNGVSQSMPAAARSYDRDTTDPESSFDGQAHYMSGTFDKYRSWEKALMASHGRPEGEQRGPEEFAQARSLAERLKAQDHSRLSDDEEAAATVLAERFAPEGPAAPEDAPDEARNGLPGNRILLALLVFVALAPTITVGIMLWRGMIVAPWSTLSADAPRAGQIAALASLAAPSAPQAVPPKQDVIVPAIAVPAIALTGPGTLTGEAGDEVPFAIALDSTEPPPRSIIAIRGLPAGAVFSAGRPYGVTEWTLRPDEIGDLRLRIPRIESGRHPLAIALLAADGTALAKDTARLDVTESRSALVTRPEEATRVGDLMAHGQKMVDVGYLPGARAYFKRAAEAGSAEAALALGATYDPAFVAEIGARGIEPEPAQARAWYERARTLGSADAEAKLIALARAAAPSQQADKAPLPAPAIVAAEAKTEAPRAEWVKLSGAANMREGPSGSSATIKVAQKGKRLRAIGRKGNWVQVSDPATKETGWIYSRFVETLQTGE